MYLPPRFGGVVALDDLSFSVREGQLFGFVGPNGAGKTTMRIVLGMLEPDRGEVRWRGRPVDAETRRRFGYMPEDHGQTSSPRCGNEEVAVGTSEVQLPEQSPTPAPETRRLEALVGRWHSEGRTVPAPHRLPNSHHQPDGTVRPGVGWVGPSDSNPGRAD